MIALTPQDLQRLINILERVSSELGLSVNLEKTKIIIFWKGGYVAERECWFLAQKEVEIVKNYKYLGLILTTRGATAQQVERVTRVSSQLWLSWDRAIAIALPGKMIPWGQLKFRPFLS